MGECASCESFRAFTSHSLILQREIGCRTMLNWESSRRNSKMCEINFRYFPMSLATLLNLTDHAAYYHTKNSRRTGCYEANGKTPDLSCLSSNVSVVSRMRSRRSLLAALFNPPERWLRINLLARRKLVLVSWLTWNVGRWQSPAKSISFGLLADRVVESLLSRPPLQGVCKIFVFPARNISSLATLTIPRIHKTSSRPLHNN
jgi:hypothetical protein